VKLRLKGIVPRTFYQRTFFASTDFKLTHYRIFCLLASIAVFWVGMLSAMFMGGLFFLMLAAVLAGLKLAGILGWSWWWAVLLAIHLFGQCVLLAICLSAAAATAQLLPQAADERPIPSDVKQRFVEISLPNGSVDTFDLETVRYLLPERFTILSITIDDSEMLKLKLSTINTLRSFCKSKPGKYPVPKELLEHRNADMPLKDIEVFQSSFGKEIHWFYPYKSLAWNDDNPGIFLFDCRENQFLPQVNRITNGERAMSLLDCKRHLIGISMPELDHGDPQKIIMAVPKDDSVSWRELLVLCWKVTGKSLL
jgi:hypothetical protein